MFLLLQVASCKHFRSHNPQQSQQEVKGNPKSALRNMKVKDLFLVTALGAHLVGTSQALSYTFDQLIEKFEQDALEFSNMVEQLYHDKKCDTRSLLECSQNNYNECFTEFPSPVCPLGKYQYKPCLEAANSCGATWDFTTSVVRLPPALRNKEDNLSPEYVESICASRNLDDYFVQKHNKDDSFWNELGLDSPSYYYGDTSGILRIFPARPSEDCYEYDPRIRPWYVAGSSGPKNIVMILDVSGSMKGERLSMLKEAAIRVVSTTTIGDRIAIVPFSDSAGTVIGEEGKYLYQATSDNQKSIIQQISNLKAGGATNIPAGFDTAFQVLRDSSAREFSVFCNTAILFFTDGQMTVEGVSEETVISQVQTNIDSLSSELGHPVQLLTYSISENDDVHTFPRAIACASNGIWSKIVDPEAIPDSLTSYYQLFARGLGDENNENFTAWTEPYYFYTRDILGITVSAPVYDRSKKPPLFLGVVGTDLPMVALDKALLDEGSSDVAATRLAQRSLASCPLINLTLCQREALRRQGAAGDEALCTSNCTAAYFAHVNTENCPNIEDEPTALWANNVFRDVSFVERGCCVGGESPIAQCEVPEEKFDIGLAIVISIPIIVTLFMCLMFWRVRRQRIKTESMMHGGTTQGWIKQDKSEIRSNTHEIPPPIQPHYRPSAPSSADPYVNSQ
jgi:Mg-chelatase subunit ChlD